MKGDDPVYTRGSSYTDPDPVDMLARPAWQSEAACRGMLRTEPNLFFPPKGDQATLKRALEVLRPVPGYRYLPCRGTRPAGCVGRLVGEGT